jgi:osmoprotectant transport system substrate-binding protein
MKNPLFIAVMLLMFAVPPTHACVGKMLTIGVVNSSEGQVLAEMLSSLINERTGTTVSVKLFKNEQDLYDAVKVNQVDISIENTTKAMHALNKPVDNDVNRAYEAVKAVYEREKGMVWLKPFGFMHSNGESSPSFTAAVLRVEVLNNFPALPRVIGKLGNMLNDEARARLIRSVESGEQPKKAARDFLKSKKLI